MDKNGPILVVLAAGMGSRYGGLKQIDPVGMHGEIIIDYSIHDAYLAGFRRVVCIIKDEMEADFKEIIGDRLSTIMETRYAYQRLGALPAGYAVPEGRDKPWGTGHALLSCRGMVDAPFAVINADDYYGAKAFQQMYDALLDMRDDTRCHYCMVGYLLENTLTEHGHVARGVCQVEGGMLTEVRERTRIEKHGDKAEYTEDGGATWQVLPQGSTVSMNLWGFTPSLLDELNAEFPPFLDGALKTNPLKGEYFLPTVVNNLLEAGRADVRVMRSPDRWYGVTYREDKPVVEKAVREMIQAGIYPEHLWEGIA